MKLDEVELAMLCDELIALDALFIDFSGDFSKFHDKANYPLLNGQSIIIRNTINHIKDELSKTEEI